MIKAIVFDMDGVYFIHGKENFIKNLIKLGVSEAEARRVFLDSEEMKEYKRGKLTDEQFWAWAIGQWKLNKTVSEVVKLLIDGYEENPRVVETVKKVRALGYKTLICSNNFPARINGLQERFHFKDNFDVIILACEIGEIKPNPKIYQELIKQAEVKPEEIFYADDYQEGLDTAKSLGIQTHFYSDFKDFTETLQKLGVKI